MSEYCFINCLWFQIIYELPVFNHYMWIMQPCEIVIMWLIPRGPVNSFGQSWAALDAFQSWLQHFAGPFLHNFYFSQNIKYLKNCRVTCRIFPSSLKWISQILVAEGITVMSGRLLCTAGELMQMHIFNTKSCLNFFAWWCEFWAAWSLLKALQLSWKLLFSENGWVAAPWPAC